MDRIRISQRAVNPPEGVVWITYRWFRYDLNAPIWDSDPNKAQLWEMHTGLGYIFSELSYKFSNCTYKKGLTEINFLRSCVVEVIREKERVIRYDIIQTL